MKRFILIVISVFPLIINAQTAFFENQTEKYLYSPDVNWLPTVKKIFTCADCRSIHGASGDCADFEAISGAGCFYHPDGYFRFGYDDENSMLIYYSVSHTNYPGTMFYVGGTTGHEPDTYGRCYSRDGKLLYEGGFLFSNSGGIFVENYTTKPKNQYPTPYSSPKSFAIWQHDNGIYLGETTNGMKNGLGLYVWYNGDAWFGNWNNNKRIGAGIMYYSDCSAKIENWNEN